MMLCSLDVDSLILNGLRNDFLNVGMFIMIINFDRSIFSHAECKPPHYSTENDFVNTPFVSNSEPPHEHRLPSTANHPTQDDRFQSLNVQTPLHKKWQCLFFFWKFTTVLKIKNIDLITQMTKHFIRIALIVFLEMRAFPKI
jgi:hypothetical protein